MFRRILACFYLLLISMAFYQCAQKGTPTGGPKDITPPVLVKAEPPNMSINFKAEKIRLYFDELVKLKDVQEQLIVSPPLKYPPVLTPQGGANKYIEVKIKDTLLENTTYTLNFGQSIVDNNEENPNSFFSYVFSTGDYLDSLELAGVVKDALKKEAEEFISVMLYKIDSSYTDSTIYKKPPNYLTNTLDSTIIFRLKNLKEGKYTLFAIKDAAKNNVFDQKTDKIAFIKDTINLPTDSIYLLNLFQEIPDYSAAVPSLAFKNKISFGYYGNEKEIDIDLLSFIPDTVKTYIQKERDKDTLNYWFTPFEMDSLVFAVINDTQKVVDTFTIKNRKVAFDSLRLTPSQTGTLEYGVPYGIYSNTPIVSIDSTNVSLKYQDSIPLPFNVRLDSIDNEVLFNWKIEPNEKYRIEMVPGAVTDFFGVTNDSIAFAIGTKSLSEYGNLTLNLSGNNIQYPVIVQLLNEKEEVIREMYAIEPKDFEFKQLDPSKYLIRVIFDKNNNKQWDTGNYLLKKQPEKVSYYPGIIEMRANWEKIETFNLLD